MATGAMIVKEHGNKAFQRGDYKGAESLYTQAITLDPSNATFYNNRALVRVRLQMWDDAISDCLESIRLQPRNMKAYYNLAQAQMGLHHPNEALTSALTAYEFCLAMGDTSANNISALILRAKKEKWELRERERIRRRSGLLIELEDSLHAARMSERRAIGDSLLHYEIDDAEAKAEFDLIEDAYAQKLDEIRKVFAVADPGTERRDVPEWLIDNISFSIMHDPVVTKNGQSYERATILEHLKRSQTDPLTREPLRKEDLRSNIALKQACADFLEKNGWAVDW